LVGTRSATRRQGYGGRQFITRSSATVILTWVEHEWRISRCVRHASWLSPANFDTEKSQELGLTSRQEARERCVGLSAISSLLQKGDSRVMSLGHPSYPRPKGTRNHSMAEKRGYVEIGETGPRKTRVAWSKLDRLNPNPDRGLSYSVVRPIEHDVIECRPFPFRGYGKPARWDTGRSSPGVGMNGGPKPCSDVRLWRNLRSPSGREPQGDGTPIVVRVRESRTPGKGG